MGYGLNHYRLLGKSGLRVSPLCLGAMTFGKDWGWGSDKDESRKIFDMYAKKGGNFIDTANIYTNGTSERFLGEFLEGRRERFVLATKYTGSMNLNDPNAAGNHRKNMMQSVEASLKRLKTDYIDLYWVHAWEFRTPVEEVMRGLDDLVKQGKILYAGISDTPAWIVSQANTLAELRGWTPFIGLQIEYSLIQRTVERDLVPMAQSFDIAITPWTPLGSGVLTGKYSKDDLVNISSAEIGSRKHVIKQFGRLTERTLKIAEEVKKVAGDIGKTPSQVSLRWLLQKPGVTSIIIGARTLTQLEDNLGCLDFVISDDHMKKLDEVSCIELGFPHDLLSNDKIKQIITGEVQIEI